MYWLALAFSTLAVGQTLPQEPVGSDLIRARIAQSPIVQRATDQGFHIYTFERLRENDYLLEVRSLDQFGWPQLIQSETLSLSNDSERRRIWGILSDSKPTNPEMRELKSRPLNSSTDPLWEGTVPWSDAWEEEYSRWLRQDVTETFFLKHDIPTDCADAVYALRWIFARMHNLPAAFELVGTRHVLSNLTSRAEWNALPAHREWHLDQRFRASLSYLFDTTNTISLRSAGYPTALTTKSLSGSYRVTDNSSGSRHAMVFHQINPAPSSDYPALSFQSDMPQSVRRLRLGYLTDRDRLNTPEEVFRRFRTVLQNGRATQILAPESHSDFSLEQLDEKRFPRDRWGQAVLKLINPRFTPDWISAVAARTLKDAILERIRNVENGYAFCQKHLCLPGTANFDSWSTPARDERIIEFYRNYAQFVNVGDLNQEVTILGASVPMDFIYRFWAQRGVGSWDPRDPIERRWGFFPEPLAEDAIQLLTTTGQARQSALSTGFNSAERFQIERRIQLWTLHWPELFIEYARAHSGVAQLLNGLIQRFSENRVTINGINRTLRQWFGFYSAIKNAELADDPWGSQMGANFVTGLFGETVIAVDSSRKLTLTEHLLLDEQNRSFISFGRNAGGVRDASPRAHVISTQYGAYHRETGTFLPCPNAQLVPHSAYVLCPRSVWKMTSAGFTLEKDNLQRIYAVGSASDGASPGAILVGTKDSFYLSNKGSLHRIQSPPSINRVYQSRSHLLIESNARWSAINLASGGRRSIPGAEDLWTDSLTEIAFFTKARQLWKMDLSRPQSKAQLVSTELIENVEFIPSLHRTYQENLGMSFRLQTGHFAFFWNRHSAAPDPIEVYLSSAQLPKAIVPTPEGFEFCSAQGLKYRLQKDSQLPQDVPMKATVGRSTCTLPLRGQFVEHSPTGISIKGAHGQPVSPWMPVLTLVDSWGHDHIPRDRSAVRASGPIWFSEL